MVIFLWFTFKNKQKKKIEKTHLKSDRKNTIPQQVLIFPLRETIILQQECKILALFLSLYETDSVAV